MSHFTVLVIGEDYEKQLQPFHEYECTGIEDEYVVDVDYTENADEFLNREVFIGINKESKNLDYHFYEENAQRDFESYEKTTKIEYLKKIEADIDKEIIEELGVEKKNGIWCGKTNPNAKWDWYTVGGRWTGYLKLKEGSEGVLGSPGLMSSPAEEGTADQVRKKDVDFEGMRNASAKRAEEAYDKAMKYIGDISEHESWNPFRERMVAEGKGIDEIREAYHNQPKCIAWKKIEDNSFRYSYSPDDFSVTREKFIEDARNSSIATFAVVKDSKWYEKGKMGWWACVSDEKEKDSWNKEFSDLLDSLSEETLLTLVDCHI